MFVGAADTPIPHRHLPPRPASKQVVRISILRQTLTGTEGSNPFPSSSDFAPDTRFNALQGEG
jgi:hypothetical protein